MDKCSQRCLTTQLTTEGWDDQSLIVFRQPRYSRSGSVGRGLAGLVGAGNTQLTPDQAQKVSPEAVQQLATHAQNSNPSVVESVSAFYAQHTTLIKTLGGAALSVALAKVAERQRQT